MICLFVGEDSLAKDEKLNEIKKEILNSEEAVKFDFDLLHAAKLSASDLKQSLIALPAVAKQRLVIIRQIEKLTSQNKKIIIDFIQKSEDSIVLILDADESRSNAFMKQITAAAKVYRFQSEIKSNVFDMTKKISMKNPSQALKILEGLLKQGDHPLQILGALVWFWGNKMQPVIPAVKFKKGLLMLQEADLNIKRSRVKPNTAIEILVTKLCCLIA